MLDVNFIKKMPKILLHEHLDGSIRAQTIIDIALKNGINLPSYEAAGISKWFIEQSNSGDLYKCLATFNISCSVMQDEESLRRIAFEFIEDMFLDGIIYAEVRFCPYFHLQKGLSLESVVESVLAGLNKGRAKYKVDFGVLICGIRSFNPEINLEMAKLTFKFKNQGVVGYDFAGADLNFPLINSVDTINYLNNHAIPFTVHTGEAASCDYILEAVKFGAKRLGHCAKIFLRLHTTTAVIQQSLELIRQNNIHIEINISSNIATGAVNIENHPFISLFNHGFNVALNTDDQLMFGKSLTSEYFDASNRYNLSYTDIKQMNINAANSAFIDIKTKEKIKNKINAYIC